MANLGFLLLFFVVLGISGNLGTMVIAAVTKLELEHVAFFYGKPILIVKTRFYPIHIGSIPTGAYAQFNIDHFNQQSLALRLLAVLSGTVAVLVSASFFIGFTELGKHFISAYPQFIKGMLNPWTYATDSIRLLFVTAQTSPMQAYGIFAVKFSALHLLPLPGCPGWKLVDELLKDRPRSQTIKTVLVIIRVACVAIVVAWFLALSRFLWNSF